MNINVDAASAIDRQDIRNKLANNITRAITLSADFANESTNELSHRLISGVLLRVAPLCCVMIFAVLAIFVTVYALGCLVIEMAFPAISSNIATAIAAATISTFSILLLAILIRRL